ncbi:four-carbon acid sugar kinase family protein [Rhodospirillales bacterium]|nr:four-carbon acid sugar kinase family protein [Rhodospirillales bacterium]
MLLGCIADDFTGATDLANTLVKSGMNTVQSIGIPDDTLSLDGIDALVIALKSRTIPAEQAVTQSLAALGYLQHAGAQQFIFKYCSTFDSTDEGNIGPVADALLDALSQDFTIACPAFPATGRSIYKGYLFVGDGLLSESGMENHPLTPMTDANLVRVLSRQTPHIVGLVEYATVAQGAAAISSVFDEMRKNGIRHAIVDALSDSDLHEVGAALATTKLITGGSGIAIGLAENFRKSGDLAASTAPSLPNVDGRAAVIAGSCSKMTRAQVAHTQKLWPTFSIDPIRIAAGEDVAKQAISWASEQPVDTPVLIYSSADPEIIKGIQAEYGRDAAGEMVERVMGRVASGLVANGVRKLVVAGGETSGAVVQALNVRALRIGPEIDPGVPWTEALGDEPLALALKSGNFGAEDFFQKSLDMLP